jgi:hypothetical protein
VKPWWEEWSKEGLEKAASMSNLSDKELAKVIGCAAMDIALARQRVRAKQRDEERKWAVNARQWQDRTEAMIGMLESIEQGLAARGAKP